MADMKWPKCFGGKRHYHVKDIVCPDCKLMFDREAMLKRLFDAIRNVILHEEMCERVRKLMREREKSRHPVVGSVQRTRKDMSEKSAKLRIGPTGRAHMLSVKRH